LFSLAVISTSLNILYQTINWENYTMTTSYTDLEALNETLTIKDLKSVLKGMRF